MKKQNKLKHKVWLESSKWIQIHCKELIVLHQNDNSYYFWRWDHEHF
jgi:hypothetical protein